jgi:DNA-binding NtrC family response regulator
MSEQINALMVHGQDETFNDLGRTLKTLGIGIAHAGNYKEAAKLLKAQSAIDLVFTGTDLQDGGWADVLALSQQSKPYTPVIVVTRIVNVRLYLDALGTGAFDYVSPPFLPSDLAHIVRSAIYKELVSVQRDMAAPPAA